MTCTVSMAWNAIASKTCRTIEPVKWPPIRWNSNPAGSPECTRYGRPDTSTTACTSASSRGTSASPNREMPGLVAERLRDGLAEHDADVFDGVVHVDLGVTVSRATVRSMSECFENAVRRWSKKGTEVSMSACPVPSRFERRGRCSTRWSARLRCASRCVRHPSSLARAFRKAVVSASVPAVTRRWCGMPRSRIRMPLLQQRLEHRVRVVDPAEQHEVRPARPDRDTRAGAVPAAAGRAAALMSSTIASISPAWARAAVAAAWVSAERW